VPLELHRFGLAATLRALPGAIVRRAAPRTPDGGVLADLHTPFDDPATLAAALDAAPGVVAHGLFPSSLVSSVLVARDERVEAFAPMDGTARPLADPPPG